MIFPDNQNVNYLVEVFIRNGNDLPIHNQALVRLKAGENPLENPQGRFEKFTTQAQFHVRRVAGLSRIEPTKVRNVFHRYDYNEIDDLISIVYGFVREPWSLISDYAELHFCFASERDAAEFSLSCPKEIRAHE